MNLSWINTTQPDRMLRLSRTGMMLLLCLTTAVSADQPAREVVVTDWVQTVEINSWPSGEAWMTAIIFRDRQGEIIDWRWARVVAGGWSKWGTRGVRLEWREHGVRRIIYSAHQLRTVTPFDKELRERRRRPVKARRGLSPPHVVAL